MPGRAKGETRAGLQDAGRRREENAVSAGGGEAQVWQQEQWTAIIVDHGSSPRRTRDTPLEMLPKLDSEQAKNSDGNLGSKGDSASQFGKHCH